MAENERNSYTIGWVARGIPSDLEGLALSDWVRKIWSEKSSPAGSRGLGECLNGGRKTSSEKNGAHVGEEKGLIKE